MCIKLSSPFVQWQKTLEMAIIVASILLNGKLAVISR